MRYRRTSARALTPSSVTCRVWQTPGRGIRAVGPIGGNCAGRRHLRPLHIPSGAGPCMSSAPSQVIRHLSRDNNGTGRQNDFVAISGTAIPLRTPHRARTDPGRVLSGHGRQTSGHVRPRRRVAGAIRRPACSRGPWRLGPPGTPLSLSVPLPEGCGMCWVTGLTTSTWSSSEQRRHGGARQGAAAPSLLAEHTMLLMLACVRRIKELFSNLDSGVFYYPWTNELAGRRLLLGGVGAVGAGSPAGQRLRRSGQLEHADR